MADSQGTPGPGGTGGRKELSMEIRLLIAFLLMGAVLFITPYFYKSSPPPPAPKPAATSTGQTTTTPAATPPAATEPAKPAEPAATTPAQSATAAAEEQTFVVETSLYQIRFSNRGAVVQSWLLKRFNDHNGKPLQLLNEAAAAKAGYPFSWIFKQQQPTTDPNKALFVMTPDADGLGVSFEYSDGHSVFRKAFHFTKDSYLSRVRSEAIVNGAPTPHLLAWRGGFGDETNYAAAATQHTVFYDLEDTGTFHSGGKLRTQSAKDAKKGTLTDRGNYSFAGIQDTYFTAVFLERQGGHMELDTYSDDVSNTPGGKPEPYVGMGVGDGGSLRFLAYVGPKDVDILGAVDPRLKTLIDWGWFEVLAKPLFYSLRWVDRNVAHNYGWSIVLVTIAINLLLLPLRFSSLKSSRKMQALAPQLKAINDKYKNISLRDPRKAEQNQEVMELYKKNGVNPVGGCLPMLPQIPILYAFYTVLRVAIEMRGAHWLWVTDLSQPEQLTIRILPLALIITQFVVQKMTPTPSADPNQARMMMFMPLMFGIFFWSYQSGLVLYWLTGNLVSMAQQWGMNRFGPAPPAPVEVVKTSGKKKGK
ncbi:MAG TPA: membrane protein insertase YidC [Bryobacteraceae bacterium]|nr:membrane protein insertase YidC [Bryobacteraceae bacterium]